MKIELSGDEIAMAVRRHLLYRGFDCHFVTFLVTVDTKEFRAVCSDEPITETASCGDEQLLEPSSPHPCTPEAEASPQETDSEGSLDERIVG